MEFFTKDPNGVYITASAIVLVWVMAFLFGAHAGYTAVRDYYYAQDVKPAGDR
ncbi:hypothetical protein [Massilia sp. DD77]|uniref:hypothetical protein n=1 Tax=Massilia sp. DD77 TaxID=3109349 RepID=UPI002FFDA4A9